MHFFACLMCFVLTVAGIAQTVRADQQRLEMSILAASSLALPLTELSRIYAKEQHISVTTSFDSTSLQANKIADGKHADIFIASHPKWMSTAKQQGLIDVYSITNITQNKLALVISKHHRLNQRLASQDAASEILSFLAKHRIMTVISNPDSTALGIYSKEAIDALDSSLWQEIQKHTIRTHGAQDTLHLITKGEHIGITYYSDAKDHPELTILATLEHNDNTPITYQAAVVAGEHMQEARNFIAFLQSEKAYSVFRKYCFTAEEKSKN